MKAGILGASGYSGETLVELLLAHPDAELSLVSSRSLAGQAVADVFPRLSHRAGNLAFSPSDAHAVAAAGLDVVFLALPHGVSLSFARPLVEAGLRVIDLSADFRLDSPERYREFYGAEHPDPDLLGESVYVLPEWSDPSWMEKRLIASPGCYPTSILLPLLPLMGGGGINPAGIVAASLSGISGAGKKATEEFSFCERAESARAYGLPKHRHLGEIEEQLTAAAGREVIVQFLPHLIPMRRGIASTISFDPGQLDLDAVYARWRAAYAGRPFVRLLPPGTTPETKLVVGTNRIDFSAVHDPRTGRMVVTSAEDNLLKGAGGQAVQIMNLLFGFDETAGLP